MLTINEVAAPGLVYAVQIEYLCLWRRFLLESIKIDGDENEEITNHG
jgi:hypothetical protein